MRLSSWLLRYFFSLIILLSSWSNSIELVAQTTAPKGALSGVVSDPTGAGIPQAKIMLSYKSTHHSLEVETDSQGQYLVENLAPGDVVIVVSATNFTSVTKSLRIGMNEPATMDFQLPLSSTASSVTVTESAKAEMEMVPGSTAVISPVEIAQSRAYILKDVLDFTPGVFANSRYGSDESQFSIRGSGLRSNYHERGVNLFINGMPYQDADGFSDFETLELMATQRVEVWKGANALRYGANTMGGAVNFVTDTGQTASPFQVQLLGGSYGLFKGQVSTGGVKGRFDYFVSVSDTELEGYREHSQQGRQRLYGVFGIQLNEHTKLRFDTIYANIAEKYPGSLTLQEFLTNPQQADPTYVLYDWGRFIDFTRFGIGLNHEFNSHHSIEIIAYGQYRNLYHPIFQVLDQDQRDFGGEFHYNFVGNLWGKPNRFVFGFAPRAGSVGARRYENVFGEAGVLANQYGARARNYGIYFEDQIDLQSRFTFVAGGRYDYSTRQYLDEFKAFGADHSDLRQYSAFSPKIGFIYRPLESIQVFGNISRSYEIPILVELTSYNPNAPGFLPLEPQDAWQFELGTRGQIGTRTNWEFAFFDTEIDNEIINTNLVPFPGAFFTIPSFRSAPNTRHTGIEVADTLLLKQGLFNVSDRLTWRTAYTWSQFRYVDDTDYGDNYLPGAPRHLIRSELRYDQGKGFWVAPNIDWSPASYFVNSANTAENFEYLAFNIKAGYDWRRLGLFVEAANLTNRNYSGTVQVDNDAGRFYEPSNGRSTAEE
ncbi:MAG: TonB-dependent receptor [Terriglobia bacterium]